jgi:hypothetical protein
MSDESICAEIKAFRVTRHYSWIWSIRFSREHLDFVCDVLLPAGLIYVDHSHDVAYEKMLMFDLPLIFVNVDNTQRYLPVIYLCKLTQTSPYNNKNNKNNIFITRSKVSLSSQLVDEGKTVLSWARREEREGREQRERTRAFQILGAQQEKARSPHSSFLSGGTTSFSIPSRTRYLLDI